MARLRARPVLWINTGLAIALVVVALVAVMALRSSPGAAAATTRTATVRSGTVVATVSGSGNVTSADAVAANFGTSGTVTAVKVKVGQKVTEGQVLATLDPASATRSLQTARAQLTSAQAQYDETAAGATSTQRAKDALAVTSAQQSVERRPRLA